MNSYELPQGRALERLRGIFAEIAEAEVLLSPSTGRKRVAASALYAAAADDAKSADPAIQAMLDEEPGARRFHRQAIADTARFNIPEAKAASSRAATVAAHAFARHGEGCVIRAERSRAEPDQFYVVIEMDRPGSDAAPPKALIVCDREDRCRNFPLAGVRGGIAQIIAESNSDLMRLIGDPTTRIYLK